MPSMADMLGKYAWIARETAPRMLVEAMALYGIRETHGSDNNPTIMEWAKTLGIRYTSDSDTPWCGLYVGIVAYRAGKKVPENPLWARNWALWGDKCVPSLGCVLVFSRGSGGHVGLYVGEDADCYHVLGGNQGDCVSIVRVAKNRLLAARDSYKVRPSNVRPIYLQSGGAVSSNEA